MQHKSHSARAGALPVGGYEIEDLRRLSISYIACPGQQQRLTCGGPRTGPREGVEFSGRVHAVVRPTTPLSPACLQVRLAVERGRATRPDIELGVCGEHGGDPTSIAFFDKVGLDYVSCSPLR